MTVMRVACFLAFALVATACLKSTQPANDNQISITEEPFLSGGAIDVRLESGDYEIRLATDTTIHVTLRGNTENAKAEIITKAKHASVNVKDTPPSNFHATIAIPDAEDIRIHLSGGQLILAAMPGNKDIETGGGNVVIAVGNPDDYSHVDASLFAGNIESRIFGGGHSGVMPHLKWSGPGKYTLHAQLGAGNLKLRR